MRRASLIRSIAAVLAVYGVVESAGFVIVGAYYSFPTDRTVQFLLAQIVFYGILAAFLIIGQNFFYIEKTGERLHNVNIANKVTLLRVSMLPSVLFLIILSKDYNLAPVLIPVIAITFLTDMIDGRLSRARNQVTRIGKILDSVSDYSLLIVIAIAYRVYDLLPTWLFVLILFRLLFQSGGMLCMLIVHKRVEPKPTIFGKIAIASIMLLFAFEASRLIVPDRFLKLFGYGEAACGIIVSISILDKAFFFFRKLRA